MYKLNGANSEQITCLQEAWNELWESVYENFSVFTKDREKEVPIKEIIQPTG